jgi:DNA-directed RNA polymerase subunit RPC12/RpoP
MPFIIAIVFWIVCTIVAAVVAPEDRRATFALLTFFLLGPIGVAAAAIAEPREVPEPEPERRAVADGRRRFNCPRCGADNDIPREDTSYDCWRCSERRNVKPPATATTFSSHNEDGLTAEAIDRLGPFG